MKQRTLEIQLQHVPPPTQPDPAREQYLTPAPIAADLLYTALHHGDITDKIVLDLGCGTGIFAVGATLLGARHVTGIDIDPRLITQATAYAHAKNLPIDYQVSDIADVTTTADTVLMNPPFGAQKANRNADRRFLEKAIEAAPVIYSLHLTKTVPFLNTMITACHAEITAEKHYTFTIPAQFTFHTKLTATYEVTLLRIMKKHDNKS
jgi:putative methylase